MHLGVWLLLASHVREAEESFKLSVLINVLIFNRKCHYLCNMTAWTNQIQDVSKVFPVSKIEFPCKLLEIFVISATRMQQIDLTSLAN